jgi:hydrogenase-4 membrane subunit HyfE
MFGVLWAIVVILFAFWLLGVIFHLAGGLIHILLVLAVLVLLYNLFMGSRRRTL